MISQLRRDYAGRSLSEADADADPIVQFRRWFDDAVAAQVVDVNAMSLATASAAGEPAVRTVLLKEIADNGLIFFTHYNSDKGRDLRENPRAALLFYWPELERQVRLSGAVTRISRESSEEYFASRPIESRWGAVASSQSAEIESRAALEARYAEVKARFTDTVPCPAEWGGYLLTAERVEFWQGRPSRLHDRLLYQRQRDDTWRQSRLAP